MSKDCTKALEIYRDAVYEATVSDKKKLLGLVFEIYQAGKKKDEDAYFELRTQVLQTVYCIQRTTITQTLTPPITNNKN